MKISNEKALEIRKDFPILATKVHDKPLIYLDNAATTQKPKQVIEAIKNYYETTNANVHRGVYTLSEKATEAYEDAKRVVAEFINANPKEVIFTRSTTESLNLLSYTLHALIGQRKEIVITEMEHHSNLVPWQQFAKRHGLTLKFIPVKDDYTLDYMRAEELITENTACIAVAHVSNALGTVNNIEKLITLAKNKGALTIIDAAQSAGHMPLDVKALDCDFLAFSSHKMMGPTGIGVLYGKKELLEKLPPFNFGGDMIKEVSLEGATWNNLPMKFEAGTPNIAGAIAFREAILYLQNLGMENIDTWEKELYNYALEKIKKIKNIKIYNPEPKYSAAIISFNIEGIHPHDLASLLDDEAVCIRGGFHCVMPLMKKLEIIGTSRVSFAFYNTYEDIDNFIKAITNIEKVMEIKV